MEEFNVIFCFRHLCDCTFVVVELNIGAKELSNLDNKESDSSTTTQVAKHHV